jgi:hypothetical protein
MKKTKDNKLQQPKTLEELNKVADELNSKLELSLKAVENGKNYFEYNPVSVLNQGDSFLVQSEGSTNRISTADLLKFFLSNLTKNVTSDEKCYKFCVAEKNGEVPINYPAHLLYADGSTYGGDEDTERNLLIRDFIANNRDISQFATYFNFSVDGKKMTVPNLKNRYLRANGENILAYELQEDAMQKMTGKHSKSMADGRDTPSFEGALKLIRTAEKANTSGSGYTSVYDVIMDNSLQVRTDVETRGKSYGLFLFIDISLTKLALTNIVEINNVIGLTEQLNLKQNITDLPIDVKNLFINNTENINDTLKSTLQINYHLTTLIEIPITSFKINATTSGATLNAGAVGFFEFGVPLKRLNADSIIDWLQIINDVNGKPTIIKILKQYRSVDFSIKLLNTWAGPAGNLRAYNINLVRVNNTNLLLNSQINKNTNTATTVTSSNIFGTTFVADGTDPFVSQGLRLQVDNALAGGLQTAITLNQTLPNVDGGSYLRITIKA